jgi:succinyl-CoA synthetase beta subunit
MDIEEVAKEDPNAIKVYSFDLKAGFHEEDAVKVADSLGLQGKTRDQGIEQL